MVYVKQYFIAKRAYYTIVKKFNYSPFCFQEYNWRSCTCQIDSLKGKKKGKTHSYLSIKWNWRIRATFKYWIICTARCKSLEFVTVHANGFENITTLQDIGLDYFRYILSLNLWSFDFELRIRWLIFSDKCCLGLINDNDRTSVTM